MARTRIPRAVILAGVLALLVVSFMGYVRLSPLSIQRWHQKIEATSDQDLAGGAVRIVPGDFALFTQFNEAISGLKNTEILAGSLEAKRITYVTRSTFFGFPDMTTIELRDGGIAFFGRLRFGTSDMGVNRARLQGVIAVINGG